MDAYIAGKNSALFWISRREIRCPFEYGTQDYNSWLVGFSEELELAGEELPTQVALYT